MDAKKALIVKKQSAHPKATIQPPDGGARNPPVAGSRLKLNAREARRSCSHNRPMDRRDRQFPIPDRLSQSDPAAQR